MKESKDTKEKITDEDRMNFIVDNCHIIELVAIDSELSIDFQHFKFNEKDDLRGDIDNAIMIMRKSKFGKKN